MQRDGLDEKDAQARILSQMPIEEKLKIADYTIDASGTLRQTRKQVEAIYRDLLIREIRVRERTR
jgi:dephospho-CoA kinase